MAFGAKRSIFSLCNTSSIGLIAERFLLFNSLRQQISCLFKEKLSAFSVKSLMRNARERRPGSIGLAEVLVINYNGKKKNPQYFLKMNKLNEISRKLTVEAYDRMLNEDARHYNLSEDNMNFDPAEGADPSDGV